ncbi:MAG TPA: uroporphyrinogen-III synthase [Longimicrobiales bacterium]|nr:uroporphyrinogen-III synthase [Longimicrobiales bacterium]
MKRGPLAGRRVVVTRARHQAAEFVEALEGLGAEVVVFPTIRIVEPEDPEPLRRAVAELAAYDWLVLTSPNGVDRFFEELAAAGLAVGALSGVRIACVGSSTAAAVEARGARVAVVPEQHVGEGLLEAMVALGVAGARILLPRAAEAREVLPDGLRAAGARVDDVAAYRTVADTEGAAAMRRRLDAGEIDVLTFTSSSSVRNFVAGVGSDVGGACVAVIGPVTGDSARALGLTVSVEADPHTVPGLVQALAAWYDRGAAGAG